MTTRTEKIRKLCALAQGSMDIACARTWRAGCFFIDWPIGLRAGLC
jgi:hypothetical protein